MDAKDIAPSAGTIISKVFSKAAIMAMLEIPDCFMMFCISILIYIIGLICLILDFAFCLGIIIEYIPAIFQIIILNSWAILSNLAQAVISPAINAAAKQISKAADMTISNEEDRGSEGMIGQAQEKAGRAGGAAITGISTGVMIFISIASTIIGIIPLANQIIPWGVIQVLVISAARISKTAIE